MTPRVALLLGVCVFLANPFACSPADDFQYDEADMRRVAEGTWTIAMGPERAPSSFSIVLTQASGPPTTARLALVRPAEACDSRTFVKSAGACSSSSEMALTGKVGAGHPTFGDLPVSGTFRVSGLSLTGGALRLALGTVATLDLHLDQRNNPAGGTLQLGRDQAATPVTFKRVR